MKVIEPINIWNNGVSNQAVYFDLVCKGDNLSDKATFYYYLYDIDMILLSSVGGNQHPLLMTGEIYVGWTNNEYAYDWASNLLNITIIKDFTTTTTTTTTTKAVQTTTTTTSTTTENLLTSTTTTTTTKP